MTSTQSTQGFTGSGSNLNCPTFWDAEPVSGYLMVRLVAPYTIYSINAADLHKLTYIHCSGQRLYSQICGRWSL